MYINEELVTDDFKVLTSIGHKVAQFQLGFSFDIVIYISEIVIKVLSY